MSSLPWQAWAVIGTIAGATALSVCYAIAAAVRVELHMHETRRKAANLRRVYAEQLAALEAQKDLNNHVQVVGQGSAQPAKAA